MFGAGMAIIGGNIAVIIAGIGSRRIGAPRSYRRVSVVIGAVGIACLLTLIIDGANGSRALPVGVVERGAVYTIVAWEIMTGATDPLSSTALTGPESGRARCSRR